MDSSEVTATTSSVATKTRLRETGVRLIELKMTGNQNSATMTAIRGGSRQATVKSNRSTNSAARLRELELREELARLELERIEATANLVRIRHEKERIEVKVDDLDNEREERTSHVQICIQTSALEDIRDTLAKPEREENQVNLNTEQPLTSAIEIQSLAGAVSQASEKVDDLDNEREDRTSHVQNWIQSSPLEDITDILPESELAEKKIIDRIDTIDELYSAPQLLDKERIEECSHLEEVTRIINCETEPTWLLIDQEKWELIVSQEIKRGKPGQPVATLTDLGWVLRSFDNRNKFIRANIVEDEVHRAVKEDFTIGSLGVLSRRSATDSEERALTFTLETLEKTLNLCCSKNVDGIKLCTTLQNTAKDMLLGKGKYRRRKREKHGNKNSYASPGSKMFSSWTRQKPGENIAVQSRIQIPPRRGLRAQKQDRPRLKIVGPLPSPWQKIGATHKGENVGD